MAVAENPTLYRAKPREDGSIKKIPREELEHLVRALEEEMHSAAEQLNFEAAALLRDEVFDLRVELAKMDELNGKARGHLRRVK